MSSVKFGPVHVWEVVENMFGLEIGMHCNRCHRHKFHISRIPAPGRYNYGCDECRTVYRTQVWDIETFTEYCIEQAKSWSHAPDLVVYEASVRHRWKKFYGTQKRN